MAIDVDILSEDKKQKYLQERHCFACGKVGHQANICHSRNTAKPMTSWTVALTKDEIVAQLIELTEDKCAEIIADFMWVL